MFANWLLSPRCCCVPPPSSSSFFSLHVPSHTWVIATSCMYIVHVRSRYPSRLLPTKSQFDSVLSKLFFRLVTKIDEAAMTVRFIQITRKSQRYRSISDGITVRRLAPSVKPVHLGSYSFHAPAQSAFTKKSKADLELRLHPTPKPRLADDWTTTTTASDR